MDPSLKTMQKWHILLEKYIGKVAHFFLYFPQIGRNKMTAYITEVCILGGKMINGTQTRIWLTDDVKWDW